MTFVEFRHLLCSKFASLVDETPRFGGLNGGPLKSDDMPKIEQTIRDDFDHFDDVYLRGDGNWLMRQRTGRLCEEIVRHVLYKDR